MVSIPLYDVVTPPYMLHSWIPLETETKEVNLMCQFDLTITEKEK